VRSPRRVKREIWHPAEYTRGDVRAIQALMQYARLAKEAWTEDMGPMPSCPSEFEVARALDWIIHQACQTYDTSFASDDENGRVGAFVEGRRSVGNQIIKLGLLKPETVPE
jgi:hypothetical protein